LKTSLYFTLVINFGTVLFYISVIQDGLLNLTRSFRACWTRQIITYTLELPSPVAPGRKRVTVRTIEFLIPIPKSANGPAAPSQKGTRKALTDAGSLLGPDSGVATIGGWKMAIRGGLCHPGDLVLFFEIDSFLPADDDHFSRLKRVKWKNNVRSSRPDQLPLR
jgi:hypothetical protein